METIHLTLDELEALRLADLESLHQDEAAERMNISRQTFGRIIESARKKTASALVNGKIIIIEGGNVEMAENRTFKCINCGNKWEVPFGAARPGECPSCKSDNIHRAEEDRGPHRHGAGYCGHRHGGKFSEDRDKETDETIS